MNNKIKSILLGLCMSIYMSPEPTEDLGDGISVLLDGPNFGQLVRVFFKVDEEAARRLGLPSEEPVVECDLIPLRLSERERTGNPNPIKFEKEKYTRFLKYLKRQTIDPKNELTYNDINSVLEAAIANFTGQASAESYLRFLLPEQRAIVETLLAGFKDV